MKHIIVDGISIDNNISSLWYKIKPICTKCHKESSISSNINLIVIIRLLVTSQTHLTWWVGRYSLFNESAALSNTFFAFPYFCHLIDFSFQKTLLQYFINTFFSSTFIQLFLLQYSTILFSLRTIWYLFDFKICNWPTKVEYSLFYIDG